MTSTPRPASFVIKGWHVLAAFIVFFGVDIAVNAIFMVSAFRTFPGETSMTPYEDGVAYNATLRQKRAQAALGWRVAAGPDGADAVRVDVSDRTGAPLEGLKVTVHLERPATEAGQRSFDLREVQPGVYKVRTGVLSGAWDLDVTARNDRGDVAKADRRLSAP